MRVGGVEHPFQPMVSVAELVILISPFSFEEQHDVFEAAGRLPEGEEARTIMNGKYGDGSRNHQSQSSLTKEYGRLTRRPGSPRFTPMSADHQVFILHFPKIP